MAKKRKTRGKKGALRRKAALLLKFVVLPVALLIILSASGYLALSPVVDERMVLKQIVIAGNGFVTSDEVIKTLGLEPGEGLMELDLAKYEKKLAESRFIKKAKIARDIKPYGNMMDGTLRVTVIEERIPVAKAMLFDRKYWLCSDGGLLPVKDADAESRFDAARRSPVVTFHSNRQTNSAEFLSGLLDVLGAVAVNAPGLITDIKLDEKDRAVMYDKQGFPLKLETLQSADMLFANLADILRMVAAERDKFTEAVFRENGEGILKLKSTTPAVADSKAGGVV